MYIIHNYIIIMNNILNVPHNSIIIPVQRDNYFLELRCYAIPYGEDINIQRLLKTHEGFQFVIIINTAQNCCESFTVKLNNNTEFEKYYRVSQKGVITEHHDSDKEFHLCSIVFGRDMWINITNYHNGYYSHSVTILGPDDEKLYQTWL